MKDSRGLWILIPGVILIPLGIALYLTGMGVAFEGGGRWTGFMMGAGVITGFVGIVVKLIGLIYARVYEDEVPIWFWTDAALIVAFILVVGVTTR